MYEYKTNGTCASKICFDLDDGKIRNLSFVGGCNGNLKAISILAEGTDARELLRKLKGVLCGNKNTSCADQLARAIETYL